MAENNARVTSAVLGAKMDSLTDEVRQMRDDIRAEVAAVCAQVRRHDEEISGLQTETARLDERQRTTTGILGLFEIIGTALAAAIGRWGQ